MNVRATFRHSGLNSDRILDSLAGRIRFTHHFCAEFIITFCSRLDTASEVVSGRSVGPIVIDKQEELRDPRLNLSREIPQESVGGFFQDNFRPEVDSDVISGVVIRYRPYRYEGSYKMW